MTNRDGDSEFVEGKALLRRFFLPSLVTSHFATSGLTVFTGLFLVDIARSFEVSVGVMGQMSTLSSVVAVVFGLIIGALSVRFSHKSLIMTGLLFITFSALGCYFSLDVNSMFASYALSGVASAMVVSMASTLIGENFPLEKRAGAVGWLIAGGPLASLGAPVIALIAGIGGWRFSLLGFVIPISLASLLLAIFSIPSSSHHVQTNIEVGIYLRSYKAVIAKRSAVACLFGDALRSASLVSISIYATSFIRETFRLPADFASIVVLSGALCIASGSLAGGRFVNRFGRKPATVFTGLLAGLFAILSFLPSLLSLTLVSRLAASFFFGMMGSAANCLVLEQVPDFRGAMMALDSVSVNLGTALGAVVGGLALIFLGYAGTGLVLGIMGIVAAIVLHLLTVDPTDPKTVRP